MRILEAGVQLVQVHVLVVPRYPSSKSTMN